jgi:DNA repair photolyase
MQSKRAAWLTEHGVTGDHVTHVIRRENAVEIARKQILSKPESFRQKKQVIFASPLVDVAANMELVRETVEICKVILELTNWDIRLLSKSNLLPKVATQLEEYFSTDGRCSPLEKIYPLNRVIYGVSTGTFDDELATAFEHGAAKVSKRIESLHWLQDNGFRTFGMICPSLPQSDEGDGNYALFSEVMAEAIRIDRCEHVWAEVINVRGDSFNRTYNDLKSAKFSTEAEYVSLVSHNRDEWERYARRTFEAHARVIPASKLRFLQYVTEATSPWWEKQQANGAILL